MRHPGPVGAFAIVRSTIDLTRGLGGIDLAMGRRPIPGRTVVSLLCLAVLAWGCADRSEHAVTATPSTVAATSIGQTNSESAGASASLTSPWVAIAHHRSGVQAISVEDVSAILAGRIDDWAQLGGSTLAIRPFLVADDAEAILSAVGLTGDDTAAELVSGSSIVDLVSSAPGGFALVPPETLNPTILALSMDGYDPYSHPADLSPLRTPGGDPERAPFRPVVIAVTGELIPARCSNYALELVGDDGAMFDGVREIVTGADVAVAPLETSLTDRSAPTPCVESVVLQGRAAIAGAIAEAGFDVVVPIGNHVTDCWDGCDGRAALLDTLSNLEEVGVATAGAGANDEEAHTPAIVQVTTDGGRVVRFAILGFDTIAPWNAATPDAAGVAPAEPTRVAERVAAATRLADHVVVAFNWGVEYTADPTPAQIELAEVATLAGAELVVGNHPHWVQAVDAQPTGVVAYALGNFVFDQSWSVPTTQGAILEAAFAGGRIVGYRLRPVVIRGVPDVPPALYRPEVVDYSSAEGMEILERIWRASERLSGAASAR